MVLTMINTRVFKIIPIILFIFSIGHAKELKNVQLLKGNYKDIDKYMKKINKDLGVKCSHCHDLPDYHTDTDIKDVAREMIKLTRYLNDMLNPVSIEHEDYIAKVSCWTCHQGKVVPESIRPVD